MVTREILVRAAERAKPLFNSARPATEVVSSICEDLGIDERAISVLAEIYAPESVEEAVAFAWLIVGIIASRMELAEEE